MTPLLSQALTVGRKSKCTWLGVKEVLKQQAERSICAKHGQSAYALRLGVQHVRAFASGVEQIYQAGQHQGSQPDGKVPEESDTIVALSSGFGRSAVAVIRISGPKAGGHDSQQIKTIESS